MKSKAVRPVGSNDLSTISAIPAQRTPLPAGDPRPSISGTSALQDFPAATEQPAGPQVREPEKWLTHYRRRSIATDVAVVVAATILVHALSGSPALSWASLLPAVALVIGWLVALEFGGAWDRSIIDAGAAEYRRILLVGTTLWLATGVVGYLTGSELVRGYLLIGLPAGAAGLLIAHWARRSRLLRQRRSGTHLRSLLVVGERVSAGAVCATVRDHPAAGYQVAGVFLLRDRLSQVRMVDDVAGYPVVGSTTTVDRALNALTAAADVSAAAAAGGASFVALADDPDNFRDELLMSLTANGIGLLVAPNLLEPADPMAVDLEAVGLNTVDMTATVGESDAELHWVAEIERSSALGKSMFDLTVTLLGLVVLSPLMLVAAFAVVVADGGPIIHRTDYLGINGTVFPGWSFRCTPLGEKARPFLRTAADENSGYVLATTRVGRLLRRSGLEQSPQLANVLRRQMSLVGPKPHHAGVLDAGSPLIRPGITGRWRIQPHGSGRSDDAFDVIHWSARADIAILGKTLRMGLAGRLAS